MFFITNSETEFSNHYLPGFSPCNNHTEHALPENLISDTPYELLFSTMRTQDVENHFNFTCLAPADYTYSTLSQKEAVNALTSLCPHRHNFFEFMFVLEGEIYVNIENQRHLYSAGSCCILNKNVMHMEEYHSDFRIVFLELSSEFLNLIYQDLCLNFFDIERLSGSSALMKFFDMNLGNNQAHEKDYVDFIPNTKQKNLTLTVHQIFDQLTLETISPRQSSSLFVKYQIEQLFAFLMFPEHYSTTPIRIGTDAEYELYNKIINSMMRSFGRISRSQLSQELNYSGVYLNEIAKKYSGLSLFDLGMTFCMKETARLLTSSNDSVTDIGSALGFTNRTHFYKIFKRTYGMTPAEYRRAHIP